VTSARSLSSGKAAVVNVCGYITRATEVDPLWGRPQCARFTSPASLNFTDRIGYFVT
jgi:hypothetical protein